MKKKKTFNGNFNEAVNIDERTRNLKVHKYLRKK